MEWIATILYAFVAALGQLLPVSMSAHEYFLGLLTHFDSNQPLLQMCIHLGIFCALFLFYRQRVGHIYREYKNRTSRRQSDTVALLDGKVILSMVLPAAVGLLLTGWIQQRFGSLPLMVLFLVISGTVLYLPHFVASGNRDSNHLSRLEALLFGLSAAFSAFPGLSRVGGVLSTGALCGCSRTYLLDMAFLMLLPLLLLQTVLHLFSFLAAGFAMLTWGCVLLSLLAGIAAFAGASLAISAMRFLSVNRGYAAFAYYNWGLAIFGFILYLVI